MNQRLFELFYSLAHQNSFMDWLIIFLANYLGYIIIVALLLYALINRKRREIWQPVGVFIVTAILAWFVAVIIKYFYPQPRPFEVLNYVEPLFKYNWHDSFPSGHSVFFGAIAFASLFLREKAGWLLLSGSILIGLARIAAGVHWPIDVLAGFGIALLVAALAHLVLWHQIFHRQD